VLRRTRELGFAAAGIAPARAAGYGEQFLSWLREGKHGEMDYLQEHTEVRLQPARITRFSGLSAKDAVMSEQAPREAKSFVVVLDVYQSREAPAATGQTEAAFGRIARYARKKNYHDTIKKRLHLLADELRSQFPGEIFRTTVDTAPVMERELASLAGLGWQAKNTMLIHRTLGSYAVIGCVATTLDLAAGAPAVPETDHCGTCTRCIDACPTRAITPYSVDASRCVSYLTIEHRSSIDPSLHSGIGGWLAGCDVCQEVCPHNSPRDQAASAGPLDLQSFFDPFDVLRWDEPIRRSKLTGSALKRISLPMLRRNAIINATNAVLAEQVGDVPSRAEFSTTLGTIAQSENEPDIVRQTARQSLRRLAD
jgi:epoxyqueuosine reductase